MAHSSTARVHFPLTASALALALSSFCGAPVARAQEAASKDSPVTLAEKRAAAAYEAYEKQEYAAAVALYLEAYDAAPSGSILYNVARLYDTKLADRPLAIEFYRRYIGNPGAYTERIVFANQRLAELREAEASASRAPSPQQQARREAAAPEDRAQPAHRAAPPAAAPPEKQGWSTLRWSGLGVGALGIAGLGAGAVFGVAALSADSTAEGDCNGSACTSEAGVDAAERARRNARASDIAFAAGGVLVLAGAALFVFGGDSEGKGEAYSQTALRWQAITTPSAVSVRLSGAFE